MSNARANANLARLGTALATTSGTTRDFTGIPSWAARVTVHMSGVSTNGSSAFQLQIGAGSIDTSGYNWFYSSVTTGVNASASHTTGFHLAASQAAQTMNGIVTLSLVDPATNTWAVTSSCSNSFPAVQWGSGNKSLSGRLDRIRLTTLAGTDTFDAGVMNIFFE